MNTTTVHFYDGQTSKKHEAVAHFLDDKICIYYTSKEGKAIERVWSLSNIQKDDVGVSSFIRLTYTDDVKQVMEIVDTEARDLIVQTYASYPFANNKFDAKFGKNGYVILGALAAVVGFLAFIYFIGLPFVSDTVAKMIPKKLEVQYGDGIANTYLATENIDSPATKILNNFFDALQYERGNEVKLYVVKNDIVNAFALPGNTIVVYDEIIRRTETKEQLAALLAHEYSHVAKRHAMRSVVAGMSSGILLSIVIGDVSGVLGGLAQNADQLRLLKYSRDFENEADDNGLQLMLQSKIDPKGMSDLFALLQKEEKELLGNKDIMRKLEFLSTHPLTDTRIANVQKFIKKKKFNSALNQDIENLYKQLKSATVSYVF